MKANPASHQLCLPFPQARWKRPEGSSPASNAELGRALDEIAELLENEGANPFRVRAYRTAAGTLRGLDRPVTEILDREGVGGLEQLPGIGRSLAHSIAQLVASGRSALLERLRDSRAPEKLFATVPDIGPQLARQIHDQLAVRTLAELEQAARDGRLARVPGMGPKRIRAVRESLAGRFRRAVGPRRDSPPPSEEPPVAELLDVDQQYRLLADLGRLPRIAPRRFNPTHEAWLPVLHTQRGARHYTAMYSNTARAHELGTLRDWVVIYRDDSGGDGQWTVVTSRYGQLQGRRIISGREAECAAHYQKQPAAGRRRPK
jgi:hypothetical protein